MVRAGGGRREHAERTPVDARAERPVVAHAAEKRDRTCQVPNAKLRAPLILLEGFRGARRACWGRWPAASRRPTVRRSPPPGVAAADRVHSNPLVPHARAGQTAITDATIWTAVEECQAESATFDCPASQATYGPIEDWDVGAVTSLNTWGAGCTETRTGFESYCGRASPIRFDVVYSRRF